MALFVLVFLVVALILIGVGIAVGLVACGIAAVLLAVGMVSSSVVIGLLTKRPSVGVRSFLLQCAVVAGIPSGMVCAWLAHSIFIAYGDSWLILLYGGIAGAVAAVIVVLLVDFIFLSLTALDLPQAWQPDIPRDSHARRLTTKRG